MTSTSSRQSFSEERPQAETDAALEIEVDAPSTREVVESAVGSAALSSLATGIVNGVASGALSLALNTGVHLTRHVALTCAGIREIDWAKHAVTASEAAASALLTARAVAVSYAPEPVASIVAATDKPSRIPFLASMTHRERREISAKILRDYPDRCPVIVERGCGTTLPLLGKRKFLAPCTMTNAVFTFNIRRNLNVPPSKGVWLYEPMSQLPLAPPQGTVMEFYEQYRSDDGFLYLEYREENIFG